VNNVTDKTVLVLGPPRSGTSLLANILHHMGVDMGNIRNPDYENPTGYYEDSDLQSIQDKIIKDCGEEYNGFNLPDVEDIIIKGKPYTDEIEKYISNRKKSKHDIWGWKTIQTSLMLPLFIPFLNNVHVIVSLRGLENIAKSQARYTKNKSQLYKSINLNEALEITSIYYKNIFQIINSTDLPVLYLTHEKLLADTKNQVFQIVKFLEIKNAQLNNINKFIHSPNKMIYYKIKKNFPIYSKKSYIKHALNIVRNPIYHYEYIKSLYRKNT